MKRTLRVLRQLVLSYLAAALMYRADFLQGVFSSLLWSAFSFTSAFLVSSQTAQIPGLARSDLLLLASAYGIIVGFHHWLCGRGFYNMPETIHKGELDAYLLKPFDALTFLSLRSITWSSVPRLVGSIFLTAYVLQYYQIAVSWLDVVTFIVLGIFSFLFIYGLYALSSTVLIWHPYLSNIMEFVNNSVGSARYPLDMQKFTPTLMVLYFLPFLLIVNVPVHALTHRLTSFEVVALVGVSLTTFTLARLSWKYALRHCTGAGA